MFCNWLWVYVAFTKQQFNGLAQKIVGVRSYIFNTFVLRNDVTPVLNREDL